MTQIKQVKGSGISKPNAKVPDVPDNPSTPTSTGGQLSASVAFTPATTGGAATFTVTSTPGSITNTGTSSPIKVTGLTGGTSYTFKVQGSNETGTSALSSASNAVTPYSGSGFVAIANPTGAAGTPGPMVTYVSSLGTEWTKTTGPTVPNVGDPGGAPGPNRLRYGNGNFWSALTYSNKYIYSSNDGATWTSASNGTTGAWDGMWYTGDTYIATNGASNNGQTVTTLGNAWTTRDGYPAQAGTQWFGLAGIGNNLVATYAGGGTNIYYTSSPTATNWSTATSPVSGTYWREVLTNKSNLYVCISNNAGTQIITSSSNSGPWTQRSYAETESSGCHGCWGSSGFAYAGTTGRVHYSATGTTWAAAQLPWTDTVKDVGFGNGTYVAIPNSSANYFAYSTNLTTWTQVAVDPVSLPSPFGGWAAIAYKTGSGY